MSSLSRKRRSEKGSSLLESALVLSITAMTLIGIVDVGQVMVIHQGLTERVRAGARWGIAQPYDSSKIKNVVLYNTPDPPTNAKALLGLTPAAVAVSLVDTGTPEARIVVAVENYTFRFFTPLISGARGIRPIRISMPVEEM